MSPRPGLDPVPPPAAAPAGPDRLAVTTTALLLVVAGAVLVLGLALATGADDPSTLADPGPATTSGLPLARYLQALLGVLAVGCTLVAALAPGQPGGDRVVRRRALAALGPTAATLGAVTVVVYLLRASDLSGRPLPQVLTGQVQQAFLGLPQARAELLVLLAAVVLAAAARLRPAERDGVCAGLLVLATTALLPPGFVGHSASAADHELAVASVSVHVVAGALWVGGLAVLAVLVLADHRVDVAAALPTVRAFSTVALVAVVALGASGLLNASLRVTTVAQLTGSAYGVLLLAKAASLVVLVGFGRWHRSRSITRLADGAGRPEFVRLVLLELLVMVLTVATAVVLSRTAPPLLPGS